jgi:CRP-like cAMP-binding protein
VITTVEKVLFLKSIDLFRALPGEELAQIAEIAEEVPASGGDIVFTEGEPGDALYIVLEGRVQVRKGDRKLAELGERECFGEMSVLDAEPRSATVAALSEAMLLKIGREEFKDILGERPEIAAGIMKVLSRRLRNANTR